jgi:hypothetical protein
MAAIIMRRLALALALPACVLAAAAPAAAAERAWSVTDFDRVQIEGPYEVTLVTGRPSAARGLGSAQALEGVIVEVQGGQLRIHRNPSAWGGYPGAGAGPLRIEVSTRDLRGATVIGAGRLAIDRVRGLRAELSLSGSGRIEVGRLEADTLFLGLVGSGAIRASGTARQVRATIQGSGDLVAADLVADDLTLTAETAGRVAITARRSAKVRAGGSGDVEIGGSPACTVTALGAGRVRCGAGR